ncbi:MAG: hypothetical protein IKW60_01180 [Clostridia bacterium]|nr:hypothetical protein [Clostridia bacterium]
MFLPPIKTNGSETHLTFRFGGLDLRHAPAPESLSAAENLSAAAYPALTARPSRKTVAQYQGISSVIGDPLKFTGMQDGQFYYQGKLVPFHRSLNGTSLVEMNGKILIFPDKLYYDSSPDPETGEAVHALQPIQKSVTLTDVTFYGKQDAATGVCTACLERFNGGGFSSFCKGESVQIEGSRIARNNTVNLTNRNDYAFEDAIVSAVVDDVTDQKLQLLLYTKNGKRTVFSNVTEPGDITVSVNIPDMNYVMVHNNRLWGTDAYGENIYASALGDFRSFYSFQGLAGDSWYAPVTTPGDFTGITAYRNAVIATKQTCLHHVYGDRPANFSIPKHTESGCLDGRSLVQLQGVLYYLAPDGVYAYTGGEPYCISQALPINMAGGIGGTDGRRYYLAITQRYGEKHLLVYDPEKNLWQREDDTPFIKFMQADGKFYGVCKDGIFQFNAGEEQVNWSMVTQPLSYETMRQKGANCLRLLLDTEEKTRVSVSVSHDGGEFVPCGELSASKGRKSHRLPIRFQNCDSFRIRVEGQGPVVLHGLELTVYQGGKTYAF